MSWNAGDLQTATNNVLASSLMSQIDAIMGEKKRVSVPFQSIAIACEFTIDEEAKVIQITAAITSAKGYISNNYYISGFTEFCFA